MKQAIQYKEQGNEFFKLGDYKRALAKYARVQAFTNAIQPIKNQEVAMFQNLSKKGKVIVSMITSLQRNLKSMRTNSRSFKICRAQPS